MVVIGSRACAIAIPGPTSAVRRDAIGLRLERTPQRATETAHGKPPPGEAESKARRRLREAD